MLSGNDVSIRIGARVLLDKANFRLDKAMRVGLVGRNGAGKTTLLKVISKNLADQDAIEVGGSIIVNGSFAYLPQDSRVGDITVTALDRILSVRGLDETLARIAKAELQMSTLTGDRQVKAMERYARLDHEFTMAGGWAAKAEAAQIAAALGLDNSVLAKPLQVLSGGQRRRVEIARVLFADSGMLLLDEPTNHLDQDSIIWLRDYLRNYQHGFIVITHSVDLLDETVNQIWYLDANRSSLDVYAMGWSAYLKQRVVDEQRRKRERVNAQKKAAALQIQAQKIGAKATKAQAAHSMEKRAEKLISQVEAERPTDKVANLRFPSPAACGKVPIEAKDLAMAYGSLEIFAGLDLAVDRGSRVVVLGLNGAGKTTLLRIIAGVLTPLSGEVLPGHGIKIGYFAQEHETLLPDETVIDNMMHVANEITELEIRKVIGSFLFTEDDVYKPAKVISGGEKTRIALATLVVSAANVLLLDEPTNNLDPASREQILQALRKYEGAVVLVTHDPGAVEAIDPQRVIILPDGDEDLWSNDYLELVSLA